MDVYNRLLFIVEDTRYDHTETHRATRVDPAEGVFICADCGRQNGDEHEEKCATGIIEEWLSDNTTRINRISEGIIRDYEERNREVNQETTGPG